MDDPHRSTVYDLTALRLHADGTRVHQTSDNLTLGKRKDIVHNPRHGWFAKDAGGSSVIGHSTTRALKRKASNVDDDGGDDEGPGMSVSVTAEREVEGGRMMKRKKVHPKVLSSRRTKKKQQFKEYDTFITKLTQVTRDEHGDDEPSADLLKSIHRHTAGFYKQRGVLYAPRKHRYEAKKKKEKQNEFLNTPQSSQPRHLTYEEEFDSGEDDGLGKYLESPGTPTPSKNMYRGFEGSFLLGLGILTQEKTASLLEFKTPQKDVGTVSVGAYPTPYPSCIRDSSDSDDNIFGEKTARKESPGGEVKEEVQDQAVLEFEEWYGITPIPDEDEENTNDKAGVEGGAVDTEKGGEKAEVESEEITQFTSDEDT